MKKIQDANLEGRKILIRCDFNVSIAEGKPEELFKLKACRETLNYLLAVEGTRVALCSHLGRPEGKPSSEFSLGQLRDELAEILGKKVIFVDDCVGGKVKSALEGLADGEVLLLENTRFYPGEEKNSGEFSQKLAENFEVFVNEAFSVCHRDQSSVTGVAKLLPSYAGFWLQKEIENMEKVLSSPERPATAIIGGAKIETKLPLIKKFEQIYDNVLVGGKVANEALDEKIAFSEKVVLPVDFEGQRLDIGKDTIRRFKDIIAQSKTVVWNGPLGKFEENPYDFSTREILDFIAESEVFSLVGGGESVQVLEESSMIEKISFVSTGGGAMLEYLSGNKLPGLDSLS